MSITARRPTCLGRRHAIAGPGNERMNTSTERRFSPKVHPKSRSWLCLAAVTMLAVGIGAGRHIRNQGHSSSQTASLSYADNGVWKKVDPPVRPPQGALIGGERAGPIPTTGPLNAGSGHRSGWEADWDAPTGKASIMAAVFGEPDRISKDTKKTQIDPKTGKKGKDWHEVVEEKRHGAHIQDLVALSNGDLIVTGLIQNEQSIPKAQKVYRISKGAVGADSCFVARLSADGMNMRWFAVLPERFIVPSRMAIGPDESVYLGGSVGENLASAPEVLPGSDFKDKRVALAKIAPDGSRLLWVRPGGPNQSDITGMDVDAQGRVYWTGSPSGQGQASYLLRMNSDGEGINWEDTGSDKPSWTVYLHPNQEQLKADGQYFAFYNKAGKDGFDYDGDGKWGPVRWGGFCFRLGGQVVCLPDGDVMVSSCLFYNFRVGQDKSFPAFDYFLARFSSEGKVRWSTNLYRAGDSVHTPDQKPIDLTYDAKTGKVFCLAKQHGSNLYRFMGDLRGDTGNMMICWVGRVDANTGALEKGWYFQNSRNTGFDDQGRPQGPPHPQLAGNSLKRIRVDGHGRVYLVGSAGAKMWTTSQAWKEWPAGQAGGGQGCLIVLDHDLNYLYATCIGNGAFEDAGGDMCALAVTPAGVFAAGEMRGAGFSTADPAPAWAMPDSIDSKACLVRFKWDGKP